MIQQPYGSLGHYGRKRCSCICVSGKQPFAWRGLEHHLEREPLNYSGRAVRSTLLAKPLLAAKTQRVVGLVLVVLLEM